MSFLLFPFVLAQANNELKLVALLLVFHYNAYKSLPLPWPLAMQKCQTDFGCRLDLLLHRFDIFLCCCFFFFFSIDFDRRVDFSVLLFEYFASCFQWLLFESRKKNQAVLFMGTSRYEEIVFVDINEIGAFFMQRRECCKT